MFGELKMKTEDWLVEIIPDGDLLYMRIHADFVERNSGDVRPGAFRDHGNGMSTNWNKYAGPEETRNRGVREPEKNGVISFNVGRTRAINSLIVTHSPDVLKGNRAHTDVIGEKSVQVRLMLSEIYTWEIRTP